MCVFWYAGRMADDVRIYIGEKLALTVEQAAQRHKIKSLDTMHSIIRRARLEPDGYATGRTPLYLAEAIDAAMAARKGTRGRPRKQQPA